MRHVEIESFVKSFMLFFISMGLLAGLLYYANFARAEGDLDDSLYGQMRLCSFDLACKKFVIGFETMKSRSLYSLLRNDAALYAYFPISQSEQYVLKLSYPIEAYRNDINRLQGQFVKEYAGVLVLLGILSALFSVYALSPLRSALRLTREFVRDILHDVNTPLSSLRLNVSMLQKECRQNSKLDRIEQSVETILSLQDNLRSYLDEHPGKEETLDLADVTERCMETIEKLYPDLVFGRELQSLKVTANRDAMIRIVDNLLTNAAKYNRSHGSVVVTVDAQKKHLTVSDSGQGILEPEKVFKRFYTENDKGVGIGLHIVKKLCDAMHIGISLESTKGEGSTFTLDLTALT